MSTKVGDKDRLYNLLPVLYRERDEQQGSPLRDLLRIVTEQADILYSDIQLLWDDFFIETCEPWVIPYIGDLVSNNLLNNAQDLHASDTANSLFPDLFGPSLDPTNAIRTRADVARTIYYRRRKGTLPMLEEMARDVTGWAAHAVEFFELLIWNQNLNHLRMFSNGCVDLRSPEAVDRLNGAFDFMAHTIDVRAPRQLEGWHNIRNIGFFLWRLKSYLMENVVAHRGAQPWQYYFSPLGNSAPLFARLRREGDEAGLSTELHVPGPIRPAAFFKQPGEFYGTNQNNSLIIWIDNPPPPAPPGPPVPLAQIRCRDLSSWSQPNGNIVAIDVRRGRIAFGPGAVPAVGVDLSYHYGFSADLGGGPYRRSKWLVSVEKLAGLNVPPLLPPLEMTVQENSVAPKFQTLNAAINNWQIQGRPDCVITIADNRNYALTSPLTLANNNFLVIQAQDNCRPHITPDNHELQLTGPRPGSQLTLSGLLFEGAIQVMDEMARLRLLHTTLVPNRSVDESVPPVLPTPSVIVNGVDGAGATINAEFRLHIAFSITGPLFLPTHADSLIVLDSIVDGLDGVAIAADATNQPGPPATLERVTILGRSFFRKLPLASEVIFTDPVISSQLQQGCVRFSFVPDGSKTPQRYRCQPQLAIDTVIEREARSGPVSAARKNQIKLEIQQRLVPSFTSIHYGHPGYCQLRLSSPIEIRTGAEDGSELGAFCHLKQPQRETNLRIRLEEYLPFGLEPGIIYVT